MFAKVKSTVFIDSVQLELTNRLETPVKATLRDDHGCVCGSMEEAVSPHNNKLVWNGLNSLPYGIYTLELAQGEDEMTLRMVKRI